MSVVHVQKAYELGLIIENYKFTGIGPWIVLCRKIERLESKIDSKTFGMTSHLSHDKAFNKVRTPSSKVENFCLEGLDDKYELQILKEIQESYKIALRKTKLSTLERKLVVEMYKENYLVFSDFAKEYGLGASYVYKIRDRAFKKIQKELEKILYEL